MRIWLSGLVILLTFSNVVAQEREFTHHIAEVDHAWDFTIMGWSPTNRVLAYFRHVEIDADEAGFPRQGELNFYAVASGDTCTFPNAVMDLTYQNGERFDKNLWLENGDYFSIQEERAVIFTPCADNERDITSFLPASPSQTSIVSYSPQQHKLLLRTNDGLYLYDLEAHQVRHVEGAVNDFDFYFGKGSQSPEGGRFAFTLSGPGDTYVIDIATAQAATVIDEPLEPGAYECCSTPRVPRWLSEDYFLASTQSLGPGGSWGDILVNLTGNELITTPDEAYRIDDAYIRQDNLLVLILRKNNGDYAVAHAPDFEVSPRSGGFSEMEIIPPGVLIVSQDGGTRASSLLDMNAHSFQVILSRTPGNYAASPHWFAAAGEQFVTIYDMDSGEWIETLAPPGYHRFHLYHYKPGTSRWSADERALAFEATQLGEQVLLVATIEEMPQ